MSSISGKDYVSFLNSIQSTCLESSIQIKNKQQFEALLLSQKALEFLTKIDYCDVEKVTTFVKSYLILFTAASNQGLNDLATFCLKKWQVYLAEKIQKKISSKFPQPKQKFPSQPEIIFASYPTQEAFEEKLQKLINKIQWAAFKDPNKAENELMKALESPLAKEIIYRHFQKKEPENVPDHIFPIIGVTNPDVEYYFLIQKYSPKMKEISFGNALKHVKDNDISFYMRRFAFAEKLDLTDCKKVTKQCVSQGHPKIKQIVLTGTSIKEEDVPKDKYPSLESVIQEKFVNMIALETNKFSKYAWQELKSYFDSADIVKAENIEYYLMNKFKNDRSPAGIEALISYINYCKRKQINLKKEFLKEMTSAFIDTWKYEKANSDLNSCGGKALNYLIKADPVEMDAVLFNKFIFSELTLTQESISNNSQARTTAYHMISDLERPRALIKLMRSQGLSFNDLNSYVKGVCDHLEKLFNELFYKKDGAYGYGPKNDPRDSTVAFIELLNEVYFFLNQNMDESSWVSPVGLNDPHKVTIRRSSFNRLDQMLLAFAENIITQPDKPGPLFAEPTDQTLACTFILNKHMPQESRIKVLKDILVNFCDYKSQKSYYPLARVVLGLVRKKDIPIWDHNSLIVEPLLAYKGIFSENISKELENEYWKALLNGKLGGHSVELIDALVEYYQSAATQARKNDIKEMLKALGKILLTGPITGINWHVPDNDELSAHARKAYDLLLSL